jgi:hypothetical protein
MPRRLSSDPVGDELKAVLVLELAEAEAGQSGFAAHALCRLAREEAHGENWMRLDLPGFISEIAETAAELGSLGVLSLQALDHATDADSPHREFIASALRASIVFGGLTYKALVLARDHLSAEIEK